MLTFDAPTHVYRWDGREVPSVTGVIRSALGERFDRVAAAVLELARQRGVAVHRACELDDAGQLDESTVDERIWPYVNAWRRFRQEFRIRVLFAERPLYSLVNGFAGQPDLAAALIDTGDVAVIDRKTGLPGLGARLQTAGYAELVASIDGMPAPTDIRRFALRMLPSGKYVLDEHTAKSDWRDFLACLAVHRLKQRIDA